jgi:GGDEF domain-containing protein
MRPGSGENRISLPLNDLGHDPCLCCTAHRFPVDLEATGMMLENLVQRTLSDGETGLWNRSFLNIEMERAVARAERYHFPVALIRITSREGDGPSLAEMAGCVAGQVRESDTLARTGDREMALLVTHHPPATLGRIEARLRDICGRLRGEEAVSVSIEMVVTGDGAAGAHRQDGPPAADGADSGPG